MGCLWLLAHEELFCLLFSLRADAKLFHLMPNFEVVLTLLIEDVGFFGQVLGQLVNQCGGSLAVNCPAVVILTVLRNQGVKVEHPVTNLHLLLPPGKSSLLGLVFEPLPDQFEHVPDEQI